MKVHDSIVEVHWILLDWSIGEGDGIPGVKVEFVVIMRNNSGEGGSLDYY